MLGVWYFPIDDRRRLYSSLNGGLDRGLYRGLNRGLKRRSIIILIGGARRFVCGVSLAIGCDRIAICERFRNSIIVCSPIYSIGADAINCVRLFWFLRRAFLLHRCRRARWPPGQLLVGCLGFLVRQARSYTSSWRSGFRRYQLRCTV